MGRVSSANMKIWTTGYNAWVMGGNPHYILVTELERVSGPFDIGKGFRAYRCESPSGKTYVMEATTGAIIGNTIADVRADIEGCDSIEVMQKQVDDARKQFETMRHEKVGLPEFWRRMKAL